MLLAVRIMGVQVRIMLLAVRIMLLAVRKMLLAVRKMLLAVRIMLLAVRIMLAGGPSGPTEVLQPRRGQPPLLCFLNTPLSTLYHDA